MEKLSLIIFVAIIVLGISVYLFKGPDGLNETIKEGYIRLQQTFQAWGWDIDPTK